MMKVVPGNIFDSHCDFLVNTINTVGAMGAGLALEFRLRVPRMYIEYMKKCEMKEIKIGKYWIYNDMDRICKKILNFPTKKNFIHPSKQEYIESGLIYFINNFKKDNINSIAFPLLGTRQGKLDRNDILLIMKKHLFDLPIEIEICLNENPDKFTIAVKNLIQHMNINEISEEFNISEKMAKKMKLGILNVKYLSDIITSKMVNIQLAEKLYDHYFIKMSKMNLYNYCR